MFTYKMQNGLINSLTSPPALPRLKPSSQFQYVVNFLFFFLYTITLQKTLPFELWDLDPCFVTFQSELKFPWLLAFYTCISFDSSILLYSSPFLLKDQGNRVKSKGALNKASLTRLMPIVFNPKSHRQYDSTVGVAEIQLGLQGFF